MNIFADFNWEAYYAMLESAKDESVFVVHENYINGGFSLAWARDTEFRKGKMVRVAVAFCSPKDKFCRKIGTYNVISNYFDGNRVLLPIGDEDSAVIVNRLRSLFMRAYDCQNPIF